MFDFDRWNRWLEAKATELREAGADFGTHKQSPKPGAWFGLRTSVSLAQIQVWETGEADWDVMDTRTKKFVHHNWGMLLDDSTFEAVFDQFLQASAIGK